MAQDARAFKSRKGIYRRHRRSRCSAGYRLLRARPYSGGAIDFAALNPDRTTTCPGALSASRATGDGSELGRQRNWQRPPQARATALRSGGQPDRRTRLDGQRGRHRCCKFLAAARIYSLQGRSAHFLQIHRGHCSLDTTARSLVMHSVPRAARGRLRAASECSARAAPRDASGRARARPEHPSDCRNRRARAPRRSR